MPRGRLSASLPDLVLSPMAFLFQRPPAAHIPTPASHQGADDVAHVPANVWAALLLPEDESATLAITRYAGQKGTGSTGGTGLPSLTCRGVLDRTVSALCHLHSALLYTDYIVAID